MKRLLVTLFAAALTQAGFAQETTAPQLGELLTTYYHIKDALVSSNAGTAATQAATFAQAAGSLDTKSLSEPARKVFTSLQDKLVTDAKQIAATKDIAQQRSYFKTFSDNFYLLAKDVKLSAAPVYQDYCPMKKAHWLSSSTAIKNPYYGSQMLTCGKISDTIK
ncbi:DUF3347 domain-containing protein [Chitinophaga sp. MM2321]|uniref:DUF3347 domain-containing protein n=1 Tax=Chitinophaga sp. MM2321 TaxID=3137178 RepID=UPI0032D584DD